MSRNCHSADYAQIQTQREPEPFRIHVLRLTRVALLIFMLLTMNELVQEPLIRFVSQINHSVISFLGSFICQIQMNVVNKYPG